MDWNVALPVIKVTPEQVWTIGFAAVPNVLVGMLVVAVLIYLRDFIIGFSRGKPDKKASLRRQVIGWIFYLLTHTGVWFICVVGIVIALHGFPLGGPTKKVLAQAFAVLSIVQLGLLLTTAIQEGSSYYLKRAKADGSRILLVNTLITAGVLLVWALMGLMALDKLGVNVTAMLAGLGLGGVALAFATKNIFENMFAAFSILMNPPFVIGDFIISEDVVGTVEHISLKYITIRALTGEQHIVPNTTLLGRPLHNYSRMNQRRVALSFGIGYAAADPDSIAAMPGVMKAAVEAQDKAMVRFDRAHMNALGENMLMFELVYFVMSPDYNLHMDIQQDILLRIYRGMEEHGIRTALNTRLGSPNDLLALLAEKLTDKKTAMRAK